MVGHTLVAFVDNIMVGKLGTSQLAAISLGNSFIFLAMSFGIGFSTAITPLIAESNAKKNDSIEWDNYMFYFRFYFNINSTIIQTDYISYGAT